MKSHLQEVLNSIAREYAGAIHPEAENYIEIDIGKRLETMGYPEKKKQYGGVRAIVPLKGPVEGMKVRIDGRGFGNYAQFEPGIAIPGFLADEVGLPYRSFVPNESLILNFA